MPRCHYSCNISVVQPSLVPVRAHSQGLQLQVWICILAPGSCAGLESLCGFSACIDGLGPATLSVSKPPVLVCSPQSLCPKGAAARSGAWLQPPRPQPWHAVPNFRDPRLRYSPILQSKIFVPAWHLPKIACMIYLGGCYMQEYMVITTYVYLWVHHHRCHPFPVLCLTSD